MESLVLKEGTPLTAQRIWQRLPASGGRIRSLEEIIDTQYQEIGKHYYELNGETADPIYQKNCELIDKSRRAITQIEAQILQVQKH